MKMTTPSLNMLAPMDWSLMTDGKFVSGLLKLLLAMAALKSGLFPGIPMYAAKKVILLTLKTAGGSLPAWTTMEMAP